MLILSLLARNSCLRFNPPLENASRCQTDRPPPISSPSQQPCQHFSQMERGEERSGPSCVINPFSLLCLAPLWQSATRNPQTPTNPSPPPGPSPDLAPEERGAREPLLTPLRSPPSRQMPRLSPASQQQQHRTSVACSLATGATIHHSACHGGIPVWLRAPICTSLFSFFSLSLFCFQMII